MDYGLLPPEVNSGRIYAGPGSGPMLAAAAAWGDVAAELQSAASGYSADILGLTGQWLGPSSMSMVAAATPYVAWLQDSAAQAAQTAAQAYGAAAAYEAAFAMTVPPPVIAANRAQLAALVATNFLGQNTPAIMATEAQYMEMWAQDTAAMYGYAAASEPASTLTPFNQPPQTTNEAGQGAQARSVAQAAGNATSARTQSLAQLTSTNGSQQLASTLASSGDPSLGPGTYGPGYYASSGSTPTVIVGPNGSLTIGPHGTINTAGSTSTVTINGTLTVN